MQILFILQFLWEEKIMELNKNIYNLRKEKGFSQEYMAEKINVSREQTKTK